jgi:hypothetical protein
MRFRYLAPILGVLLGVSGERQTVSAAARGRPFVIQVLDEQSGRGVPLVELKTIHNVSWWTDSAGSRRV